MNTSLLNNLQTVIGTKKPNCFEIQVYSKNQRKTKNPKYDEIKASIECKGIQSPLQVVFHPVEKQWVLSHGGQTRLMICRELYETYKDEKYLYPPVVFEEFNSDLDLCINHLIENQLRGDNSFVDTANAVRNIRLMMADSEGVIPTQDQLAERMSELGMPIRRQSITAMMYAAETLLPLITNEAFVQMLTRKTLDSIRALKSSLAQVTGSHEFDDQLIEMINSNSHAVTPKEIDNYFKLRTSSGLSPSKTSQIANSILKAVGHQYLMSGTDSAGKISIEIPQEGIDPSRSKLIFWLISQAGGFKSNGHLSIQGIDPRHPNDESVDSLFKSLNLSITDVMNVNFDVLSDVDDRTYGQLISLIKEIRKNRVQSNYQLESHT